MFPFFNQGYQPDPEEPLEDITREMIRKSILDLVLSNDLAESLRELIAARTALIQGIEQPNAKIGETLAQIHRIGTALGEVVARTHHSVDVVTEIAESLPPLPENN